MIENNTINIRSIQHYMYCPRRYALLEINKDWNENAFVIAANILHENVHSGEHQFTDSRKTVKSSISIYNDSPEYDLYGVTDCIEFIKSHNGVEISGLTGKYSVKIIEYKPKAPKGDLYNPTDAIQVFAQKICADYVWGCNSEAYLYYADTRKRVKLPFETEYEKYNCELKTLLCEMRLLLAKNQIPLKSKGQKCSGCSISDICFPKEPKYSVHDIIMSMKEGDLR